MHGQQNVKFCSFVVEGSPLVTDLPRDEVKCFKFYVKRSHLLCLLN